MTQDLPPPPSEETIAAPDADALEVTARFIERLRAAGVKAYRGPKDVEFWPPPEPRADKAPAAAGSRARGWKDTGE